VSASALTAFVLAAGWLVGSLFLVASYHCAGPIWIERHSLRFKLAGEDRRCSGAIGEMAILFYCAALLWLVDAATPGTDFIGIISRHPMAALGAIAFVAAIVAFHTVKAVEHPDPKSRKRLRQTYAIYAVYSTLIFAGGIILIYTLVSQFWADTRNFSADADEILARVRAAGAMDASGASRIVEATYLDAMRLLKLAQDQMTPVFIFAIGIFTVNLLILHTPLRGLFLTNAVFLTNVSTLIAIAAVGAFGAIVYIFSYNAFVEDYSKALLALPANIVAGDYMFQRRFTDIVLAMQAKSSLVGFVSEMSDEWGGLTAIVGIIQAAASRLAKKPELAGDIVTAAIEARENEKAEGAVT